jgi:hypothetical protein
MSFLKIFNFITGKRKDDIDYYEYGMTHKEAAIFVLKKAGLPLKAEEIINFIAAHNIKLRRPIKNIGSFKSSLFFLFNKNKIKYQPFTGKWSI